ncbi:hypothetical protein AB0G02_01145 [Actinosynnema sp. NPDC023658]|uniref:hypothetical protein n=1 Tax=Actinosynnema sp. NPDC023658 TaxID=3155465 RepID=UPI0033F36A35
MWQELHLQVRDRLEVINQVAVVGDDRVAADLARSEVPLLVAAVRALLDGHRPDADGYCRACWGRRWWQRPTVPCRQYVLARVALLDFGADARRGLEAA